MPASVSIIFDCDGVLVDSERLVTRVEAELLTGWGYPITPQQLRREFKGCTFADMARQLEQRLAGLLPADWMYLWAMETANSFRAELREVRGVRSVLEQLVSAGTPLCVASQSPLPRVRISLGLCDLERYFQGRVVHRDRGLAQRGERRGGCRYARVRLRRR
jgi:beta-phosphoglucomutase-like phosphatase (HAD superfamily)